MLNYKLIIMKNHYLNFKKLLGVFLLLGATVLNAQVHITDANGLNDMRNDAAGSYVLDNDIDLTDFEWVPFEFTGTLDGKGFAVQNLEVELNDENAGLFSVLNNATVSNLGVTDAYIFCNNNGGALAGKALNSTIIKCYATGEVNSGGLTGGLFGFTEESHISESFTKIEVNGHDHVGGISGHMNGGTITNCYTDSDVYSDAWQVGGIVGWAQNTGASITKCAAMGTVKSESGFTGGILGIADGGTPVVDITECVAMLTSIETVNPDIEKTYRIVANEAAAIMSTNYGLASTVIIDPHKTEWIDHVDWKDGASVTMEQFLTPEFWMDSLTWDFDNVWELTAVGPKLKWDPTSGVSVKQKFESVAKVYNSDGVIKIENAELGANINVYDARGALIHKTKANSTTLEVDYKGFVIVVIESTTIRSAHKVVNF